MSKNRLLMTVVLMVIMALAACNRHPLTTSPVSTPDSPLPSSTPLPSPAWMPTAELSPTPTETLVPIPTETPVPAPVPLYTGGVWECWERGQSIPCPYDASLSLRQMTFVSDTEAWAVGGNGYIARWDGYTWTRVESPTDKDLNDVFFLPSDNGWAVGEGGLILHWDGNAWSVVRDYQSSPPPANGYYLIWKAIAFSSPADGWVVGYNVSEGGSVGFVMHWDGATWEEPPGVPSPYDYYSSPPFLFDVVAFSPQDSWAVGEGHRGGLTLHWNGALWQEVANSTQSVVSGRYWLLSISALSRDDIWIGGWYEGAAIKRDGIVLHWNGAEWTEMQLGEAGWINAILMVSQDDGWIGGDELFHWNGQIWEKATRPMTWWDRIVDIEMSPNGRVWALTEHGAFLHLKIATQGDAR